MPDAIPPAVMIRPASTTRLRLIRQAGAMSARRSIGTLPAAVSGAAGLTEVVQGSAPAQSAQHHSAGDGGGSLSFADTERDLIHRALAATGGNKYRAAKLLGISRKRLYARLRRYDIA